MVRVLCLELVGSAVPFGVVVLGSRVEWSSLGKNLSTVIVVQDQSEVHQVAVVRLGLSFFALML